MSKMIRITQATQKNLDLLAQLIDKSKQAIMECAVDEYVREQFLKKANEQYAAIKENPELWAKELEERQEWDATLSDGLSDFNE